MRRAAWPANVVLDALIPWPHGCAVGLAGRPELAALAPRSRLDASCWHCRYFLAVSISQRGSATHAHDAGGIIGSPLASHAVMPAMPSYLPPIWWRQLKLDRSSATVERLRPVAACHGWLASRCYMTRLMSVIDSLLTWKNASAASISRLSSLSSDSRPQVKPAGERRARAGA